jgi:hypothetical protein
MPPDRINGLGLLAATGLIVIIALTLVVLAGPFGHTPRMSHEPARAWSASAFNSE